jgi:hypothetical protein
LVVELLFLILQVWLDYQGSLGAQAGLLGLMFMALGRLCLLPHLGVLLLVEKLIEVLVVGAGLAVVNGEVLARG